MIIQRYIDGKTGGSPQGGPTPFCFFTLVIYCPHTADQKDNFPESMYRKKNFCSIHIVYKHI